MERRAHGQEKCFPTSRICTDPLSLYLKTHNIKLPDHKNHPQKPENSNYHLKKKKKQQKTPTQMAGLKPLLVFNKQGNLLGFSKCLEIRTQGHPSGHTGIITLNSWHVPSRFLQGSKGKHIRCGNQLTTFLQYATLPIIGFAHVFNIFYSLRMKSVFTCSLRAAQRQGQQQKETSLSLPQELPTSTGGQKHPQSNTYLLALSLEAGRRYQPGPSGIAGQGRGEGS